ncbi:hypothetical protein [Rhodopseudomonas palustris]|uniref:hypothetical protein n=1 Tax=Rhodopseudomonas palustris TaxID=1076 RepID=UPI001FDA4232|nr:hypothetical protein [Rhodopseudomonas palustris]
MIEIRRHIHSVGLEARNEALRFKGEAASIAHLHFAARRHLHPARPIALRGERRIDGKRRHAEGDAGLFDLGGGLRSGASWVHQ